MLLLPDGKTLASSTKEGTICFWDTSVTHPRQAYVTLPTTVQRWKFNPDSQSILVLDREGEVSRWGGADFQQKEVLLNAGGNFDSHIFSGDGRLLAIEYGGGVVRVWDTSSRKLLREWTYLAKKEELLGFQADGDKLITRSRGDNLLHERDTATGVETQSWPGSSGRLYGIWATENWQDVLTLSLDGYYYDLMFSPDGNILGARADGSEGALHFWRAPSWAEIAAAEAREEKALRPQ